ncbi:MAG: methyltransferase domain-containing protein [Acidimicrobiales bacterium]
MSEEVYTHGHHESVLRSHRWRTAENSAAFVLDRLTATSRVLDVGCGPGTITADLARRVPRGEVVGLDRSPTVIETARAEHSAENLSWCVGDVYDLDFDDATFDVVFCHQVLQHLARPIEAIGEMRRVLKPGGVLGARDADFGGFFWAPSDPALDRWNALYHHVARLNGAEPDGGRYLPGWVRSAGLVGLEVSSSTWTFASAAERDWWGGLWAERVTASDLADQLLAHGLCDAAERESLAAAFRRWAASSDGVFVVPHVEVVARREGP